MSKGSIFLQYLCNLFYFYLLGWINNKLVPEGCIAHVTYQTFKYSITHSLYINIYKYILYIYNTGQNGKSIKPAPTPKYLKNCTSRCSKNTNTLPGPTSFLFSL